MKIDLQKLSSVNGVCYALILDGSEFYFDSLQVAKKAYNLIILAGDVVAIHYKNSRTAKERGDENMRKYFIKRARVELENLERNLRQFYGVDVCFGPVWAFVG